jgi:FkbM family methyltransferase
MKFKKDKNLFFDLGQNTDMSKQAKFYGGYTIPPQVGRDVAVDLGSNIGMFCLENYKTFDNIFAVEASYWNFLTGLSNIFTSRIGNVKCFNLAAGKSTGELVKIYQNGYDSVGATTSSELLKTLNKNPNDAPYHYVFSICLEGMFDFFALKYVDYLKIDIEGAEYDFLLDKDLSNICSMGIEIHGNFGKQKKDQLKNHLNKYFEIYDVKYDDEAPGHSVITYLNRTMF